MKLQGGVEKGDMSLSLTLMISLTDEGGLYLREDASIWKSSILLSIFSRGI